MIRSLVASLVPLVVVVPLGCGGGDDGGGGTQSAAGAEVVVEALPDTPDIPTRGIPGLWLSAGEHRTRTDGSGHATLPRRPGRTSVCEHGTSDRPTPRRGGCATVSLDGSSTVFLILTETDLVPAAR